MGRWYFILLYLTGNLNSFFIWCFFVCVFFSVGSGENCWAFCIGKLTPHHVPLSAIMKFPKLAFIFMFVGCLVVYLTYIKRHYDDSKPPVSDQLPQYRMDTHKHPTSSQVVSENFQYGIMFDAGSTGTRIHIFKFQMEPNGMFKFKRYLSPLKD